MNLMKKFNELPVFWHHFVLMVVFLLLMSILLVVSNTRTENEIRKFYTEEVQIKLDRAVEQLDTDIRELGQIPTSLRDTKTFDYIVKSEAGRPAYWYAALLTMLRESLNKQLYLQNNTIGSLIYVPRIDSAAARDSAVIDGEKIFTDYAVFSQTSEEELWKAMKGTEKSTVFPVQEILLKGKDVRAMAVAYAEDETTMSIMSFISEEQILDYFSYGNLPEGTTLKLMYGDTVILDYPEGEKRNTASATVLTSTYSNRISAEISIPASYFDQLMAPYSHTSAMLLILFLLIGTVLCVLLSQNFTRPLRRLLSKRTEGADPEKNIPGNEYAKIETMIDHSEQAKERMKNQIRFMLLTKMLSGSAVSKEEEKQLKEILSEFLKGYRVAVFHTDGETNEILSQVLAGDEENEDFICVITNVNETMLILKDSAENLDLLTRSLKVLDYYFNKEKNIRLGISNPESGLQHMLLAVRQAHAAVPEGPGYKICSRMEDAESDISWNQEERLYQTVLSGDEAASGELITKMAKAVRTHAEGRELFYSLQRIIKSAASELGLNALIRKEDIYIEGKPPEENILGLLEPLHALFEEIRKLKEEKKQSWNQEIVEWTVSQSFLPDLTVTMIAEKFGVSEKKIYEIIREETGFSPYNLILEERMKKAVKLLLTTSLSVVDVAGNCGYSAESTFYRVFRKYYGKTPVEYRKDGGMEENEKNPGTDPEKMKE